MPDLTFTLWALTCQQTSAGVNYAHGVRDAHDRVENQAQREDSQWGPQLRSRQLQTNLGESGYEGDAWLDSQCITASECFNSACLDLAHSRFSCDSD